jgi:hypothetical protein
MSNPPSRAPVFEPDITQAMGVAFERGCRALNLTDEADPLSKSLADRIIELARHGERDPDQLCEQALRALRENLHLPSGGAA